MKWQPKIQNKQGKDYIFCDWRRKYVRLTPEEWVRQHFLHYLVEEMLYPKMLIGVELQLQGRRADAVVYDKTMLPWMLIEFKADTVLLSQQTWDQAAAYNRQLNVKWWVISNGRNTLIARNDKERIETREQLPRYGQSD